MSLSDMASILPSTKCNTGGRTFLPVFSFLERAAAGAMTRWHQRSSKIQPKREIILFREAIRQKRLTVAGTQH
jgi:hypothetical protein